MPRTMTTKRRSVVEPASDLSPDDIQEPDATPEPEPAKSSSRRSAKKAPSPKKPVVEEKEDEEEAEEEEETPAVENAQVDDMDIEPDAEEEDEKATEPAKKTTNGAKRLKKTRFQADTTSEEDEKKGSDSDFVPSSAATSDAGRDKIVAEAAGAFAEHLRNEEAEEKKAAMAMMVPQEEEIWDHPTDALKKKMPTYFRNIDPKLFKLVVTKKDNDIFINVRHPRLRNGASVVFPFTRVVFDNCFPYGNCSLFAKHKNSPYNAAKVDQSKYGLMASMGPWSEAQDDDVELQALEEWIREVDRVLVEQATQLPSQFAPAWRVAADAAAALKAKERYQMLRNSAQAVMSMPGATKDRLSPEMLEAFESKNAPDPTPADIIEAYTARYASPTKNQEGEDSTLSFEKYVFNRLNDKQKEMAKQGKFEYYPPDPFTKMLFERHHLVLSDLPLITADGRVIPFLHRDCPQNSIISIRANPRFMRDSPQGTYGGRWVMDAIIFYRGPEEGGSNRLEMHQKMVQSLNLSTGGDYDEEAARFNHQAIYDTALAAIKSSPALVVVSDPKQKQIGN